MEANVLNGRRDTDKWEFYCCTEMIKRKLQGMGVTEVPQLRALAAQTPEEKLDTCGALGEATDLRQVSNVHFHVAALARPVQPLHVHIQRPARGTQESPRAKAVHGKPQTNGNTLLQGEH